MNNITTVPRINPDIFHNKEISTNPEELLVVLLNEIRSYLPNANIDRIKRAYDITIKAHAGQKRNSGEDYVCHPLSVAITLSCYKLDEDSILSGMLHDVVEDCEGYTTELLRTEFGNDVANIVEGVTKITKMHFSTKEEAAAENIRKMILAMSNDLRVILVKLADRLHNLQTLSSLKPYKQQLIAKESMDIYAPIANRLGLHRMKLLLEDMSLRYLRPDKYSQIYEWVEEYQIEEKNLFETSITTLKELLKTNNIEGEVSGRVKQIYSIYKKITENSIPLEELHDIIAFRIIVNQVSDCYSVLGLVHSVWKLVPNRFKDYISIPKGNGYQSLHTTIFSPYGDRMEIQIRTKEMHELAEYGIASHWFYKERSSINPQDLKEYEWLHKLLENKILEEDPATFLQSLRLELFQDEVYVFTPRGAVLELPEGASPIDFAYAIHSEIGEHCTGTKINNKLSPLNTKLKTGDIIEIITDSSRGPSRDWLAFVVTTKARNKIRSFLRKQEKDESIILGKNILEKALRKAGLSFKSVLKEDICRILRTDKELPFFTHVDDFFIALSSGTISPQKLIQLLLHQHTNKEEIEEKEDPLTGTINPHKDEGISLDGIDNIMLEYASCCRPLPGDAILGYISRGRGIVVHTVSCKSLLYLETERFISLTWDGHPQKPYRTQIILRLVNMNALHTITMFFAEEAINVLSGDFKTLPSKVAEATFTIEVLDAAHLYRAIDTLRSFPSVNEVYRLG
ncbi:MAG: RelA/SpoT family protein [Desulfovibrionaceae bacterium]